MRFVNGCPVRSDSYVHNVCNTKPVYKFDKVSYSLTEVDSVDCSVHLQENADCALSKVIEQFGFYPQGNNYSISDYSGEEIPIVTSPLDSFEELSDITNMANDLRDKYDMPLSYSVEQVFERCKELSSNLKSKLTDEYLKKIEEENSLLSKKNKGGVDNAKEN